MDHAMIRRYFRHEISVDEALKRGWLPSSTRFDVAVQRPHDADPRMHQRPAILRRHDQAPDRRLPFRKVLLGLRQLHEAAASCSMTSWRPRGSGIGSSNFRFQLMV